MYKRQGIGSISGTVSDDLKGIDRNQNGIGMLGYKITDLIGKTICQRSGGNGKENVGRNLVGDFVEPFLNTAQRILQTQIKRGAFFRSQVPDLFSFCDTDAPVSYTHLDVYKRQAYPNIRKFAFDNPAKD